MSAFGVDYILSEFPGLRIVKAIAIRNMDKMVVNKAVKREGRVVEEEEDDFLDDDLL